ncbi:MAG: hypothetical protein B0D96_01540 [Candidatus Sedimenticola endophacoides]|uniref:HprK-related kinase A n=1 Tax=Candidatus Sedimenticola endophacoides TaxID=2548426 RepID=A0A6N4DH87_9GAMM|nr:MAG: hypothetical protein B0D94_10920 [Candidatus Sedimenticola endophacoides]OQX37709.1 MAG: hypothetical protein B0D96_01540 [Candidatus Sedimenticola endophacoides]OQX39044.1 MAG: hypothetical protein B0D89_11560 [Candidatus Sedimenticola endophacoides]PUD98283.1 MAG: hypothetical protein C3L24_13075 [Candidatus Sedimenticola endophacoides]PUD98881.1 MAG: hypothetical protein C3L26_11030 [Candidatus Sedimenticola endophacoides]
MITLRHTPRGFLRNSRWLARERGYRHTVDACCDFIVDLLHAYLLDKPDLLSLHCGGVVFPQGLVLFPNTYRSGKSTLAIKLASMGLRIFSDDVIPYSRSERKGIALGILPRLRLPLPEVDDPQLFTFIDHQRGPASNRFLYCNLNRRQLVPIGERASVVGIVLLNRSPTEPPSIRTADKGDALKQVIQRNFTRRTPAPEILDGLFSLIAETPCHTLTYDTPSQAADLLCAMFGEPETDAAPPRSRRYA